MPAGGGPRRPIAPGAVLSRSRRSLFAVLLGALVGLGLWTLASPASASSGSKSFQLIALDTTAEVSADGSMRVTELITYQFSGGPFTIGTRSFLAADRDRITDFTASEDGTPLQVDPPAATPTGEWEWHLAGPTSDSSHTYQLTYTVPRAVVVGSDVGELYWQFLGTDHPGVGSVAVTIQVPGTFTVASVDSPATDIGVLRAWGHGPRQGTVEVQASSVRLAVTGVPAKTFVEARVAIPASVFTADASSGPRLPTILKEEGIAIDATLASDRGRSYEPPPSVLARTLGPIGAALGLVGAGGIWARFGREPKPDPLIGEYWREPLVDPPAVVLANLSKGGVNLGDAIGATIIDLAQRGHLTIREEKVERLGPDKVVRHLTRTGKADADLAAFEQRLMSFVFRAGPETTVDEITERAKRDLTAAKAFATGFPVDIGHAYQARAYKAKGSGGGKWVVILALVVGGLGGIGLLLGTSLGFVGIAGAVAAIAVAGVGLVNRTQTGADEAAKAKALKHFLTDFSQLKDAPAGHLILWERFLVYAVTLGVSKELLSGLEARMPAVLNDPSFGVWYLGYGPRRFDTINSFPAEFGRATAQAVAPPSKSGSGGGFSGGGGGGGGGGGFGAR